VCLEFFIGWKKKRIKEQKSKSPEIYLRELYNLRSFRMFVYYFIFYISMPFNLLTSITEMIIYFIHSHVSNSLFDHASG
jgi:hypothetical protein